MKVLAHHRHAGSDRWIARLSGLALLMKIGPWLHMQGTKAMFTRSLFSIPAILLTATLAYAEVPCMPKDAAVSEIMGPRYSEYPLFEATLPNPNQAGAGQDPVAVTVFANPSTGTWTMIVSPDGKVSCLVMAGKDFRPASVSTIIGKLSSYE
jgi:hypothetical protein